MRKRALIINAEVEEMAKAAIKQARANVIPWKLLAQHVLLGQEKFRMTLADKQDTDWRPPSQQVLIPFGYRVALSFEQQPAGLIRHISISVDTPGNLPHPVAVEEICKLFGFRDPFTQHHIWTEEFDPGHEVVNIAQLEADLPEGRA